MRLSKYNRKTPFREPNPTTLIICEGDTESNYIKGFIAPFRLPTVSVIKAKHSNPEDIVKEAISKKENDDYDFAFAVFDGDHEYQTALNEAKRKKVQVIVSIPCFEIWLLLHLKDTDKGYNSCKEVIKDIESTPELCKYSKNDKQIFKRLKNGQDKAEKSAFQLTINKESSTKTNMHELVDHLKKMHKIGEK